MKYTVYIYVLILQFKIQYTVFINNSYLYINYYYIQYKGQKFKTPIKKVWLGGFQKKLEI